MSSSNKHNVKLWTASRYSCIVSRFVARSDRLLRWSDEQRPAGVVAAFAAAAPCVTINVTRQADCGTSDDAVNRTTSWSIAVADHDVTQPSPDSTMDAGAPLEMQMTTAKLVRIDTG